MALRRLILLAAVLSAAGCGYHLPGRGSSLPADVQTVYIDLFVNRTVEPFLENGLTNEVAREFARRGVLRPVADAGKADALLTGEITGYETVPISFDRNDEITEYRSLMTVSAVLRRADTGRVLWKGGVSWSEEYPASADKAAQEDNEAAAVEIITARLAEELRFRILDGF